MMFLRRKETHFGDRTIPFAAVSQSCHTAARGPGVTGGRKKARDKIDEDSAPRCSRRRTFKRRPTRNSKRAPLENGEPARRARSPSRRREQDLRPRRSLRAVLSEFLVRSCARWAATLPSKIFDIFLRLAVGGGGGREGEREEGETRRKFTVDFGNSRGVSESHISLGAGRRQTLAGTIYFAYREKC